MPSMAWQPLPCTLLGLLVCSTCQTLSRSQDGECFYQMEALRAVDGIQIPVEASDGHRLAAPAWPGASLAHKPAVGSTAAKKAAAENNTIADASGVNIETDTRATLYAVIVNGIITLLCMGIFSALRVLCPILYSYRVLEKKVPLTPDEGFLGWLPASFRLSVDEAARTAGLDCAMFLEFAHLCMKLLTWLSVPLVMILWPLWLLVPHYVYDWAKACAVWYVVLVTEVLVHRAYTKFYSRRAEWWRRLPRPWATTIVVENIPLENRSDQQLKALFDAAFQREAVEAAYVVRRTGDLPMLTNKLQRARERLKESEEVFERTGQRPTNFDSHGTRVDSIDFFGAKVIKHERAAREALDTFHQALNDGGHRQIMSGTGFVTFHRRTDVMEALKLRLKDCGTCTISFAPNPENVHYTALMQDRSSSKSLKIVGYSIILTAFLGFGTLLLGVISIMKFATIEQFLPPLSTVVRRFPHLPSYWDGLAGSIVISGLMNCVLALLAAVIRNCFLLHSESAVQHNLQCWYYTFLVIYVLLVTTLGSSVWDLWFKVSHKPFVICTMLATSLPKASNFYMKFVMLQITVESLMLTRYLNLLRFFMHRRRHEESRARTLAEPEDQDWDGIGARCARASLVAASVLVFCTESPPICIFGLVYFVLGRIYYGYLVVFAETRKPDLGGVFWTAQLRHLRQGLFLYVVLMVEILRRPEAARGPSFLAGGSLAIMLFMSFPLKGYDDWEHVEALDSDRSNTPAAEENASPYMQPELRGL